MDKLLFLDRLTDNGGLVRALIDQNNKRIENFPGKRHGFGAFLAMAYYGNKKAAKKPRITLRRKGRKRRRKE